jgi:hypothetical protein
MPLMLCVISLPAGREHSEAVGAKDPITKDKLSTISRGRQERALKIWEMFEKGAKVSQLAELFGISERMIYKDLSAAKAIHKASVENVDQGELLGGSLASWRMIYRQAMRDYQIAQNDNAKIGFMRVASEARAKLDKLLQDSGLMTRVPERLALETEIPFEDPDVRKAYLGFLKLARERGEKDLGL